MTKGIVHEKRERRKGKGKNKKSKRFSLDHIVVYLFRLKGGGFLEMTNGTLEKVNEWDGAAGRLACMISIQWFGKVQSSLAWQDKKGKHSNGGWFGYLFSTLCKSCSVPTVSMQPLVREGGETFQRRAGRRVRMEAMAQAGTP